MRRRKLIALFGSAAMWPGALNAKLTRTRSEDLGRFRAVRVAVVEVSFPMSRREVIEEARALTVLVSRCGKAERRIEAVFAIENSGRHPQAAAAAARPISVGHLVCP